MAATDPLLATLAEETDREQSDRAYAFMEWCVARGCNPDHRTEAGAANAGPGRRRVRARPEADERLEEATL